MKTKAQAIRQYRKFVGTVPGYVYQLPNSLWKWCTADSGIAGCLINNVSFLPTEDIKAVRYEAI